MKAGLVAEFQESQLTDLNAAQMGKRLRLDLIERRQTALRMIDGLILLAALSVAAARISRRAQ